MDTNVLVSALIAEGPPARVLGLCWTGEVEFVISEATLAELEDVLGRSRLEPRLRRRRADVGEFIRRFEKLAKMVEPTETLALSDDPDDNRVLEAAVAGEADYLVTGDDDLVRLREVRGTRICTPAQFLIELAGRD